MSASVDNLALNKKGTKVVITGKPKYYNLFGTLVQWGIPFLYLSIEYDLFTFKDSGLAFTGWGMVGVGALFLMFRSKIREKLRRLESEIGETYARIRAGSIYLSIASVLFVVYFISYSLFLLFFILSASTFLSLSFYKPYDELIIKKDSMQKLLEEKNKVADFEVLTQKYNELQAEQKAV